MIMNKLAVLAMNHLHLIVRRKLLFDDISYTKRIHYKMQHQRLEDSLILSSPSI